jgi:hypothetical protein
MKHRISSGVVARGMALASAAACGAIAGLDVVISDDCPALDHDDAIPRPMP